MKTYAWAMTVSLWASLQGCPLARMDGWDEYDRNRLPAMDAPRVLPQSNALVFWSPKSGRGDIYRCDRDGRNRSRLTSTDDFEGYPVPSPRGDRIAYMREESGMQHIWIMDSEGKDLARLTAELASHDRPVEFSPDGTELLFYRCRSEGGAAWLCSYHLLRVDAPEAPPQDLGSSPVFTPDGEAIIYVRLGGGIWEHDRRTGEKRLLKQGEDVRTVALSPDARRILFTRQNEATGTTIWSMDRQGQDERYLTAGRGPRVTKDGSQLVFFRGRFYGQQELWVMEADGGEERRLLGPGNFSSPALSPDGRGFYLWYLADPEQPAKLLFLRSDNWTVEEVCEL